MIKLVNNIKDANCITHSGTMHSDEVFATAFLSLYLGDIKVYRSKGDDLLKANTDSIIYDIGRGVYDHHQIDATKRDNGITYSSFGLLWKKFGKDYLEKNNYDNIDLLFDGIDKDLVEGIDADDNGFFPKIDANYKVKTLPNIIKMFNPSYDSGENEQEQFLNACNLAKIILEEEIIYINGKVISDKKVDEIINNSDTSKGYLYLEEYIPFEDAIMANPKGESILFVAYPSNRGGYAIKTVGKNVNDKTARRLFPEEWKGLEGEELEKVSNINGLRFCHSGRFIVNCKDYDSMIKVLEEVCK